MGEEKKWGEAYRRFRKELIRLHAKQRSLIFKGENLPDKDRQRLRIVEQRLMELGQEYIRKMRKYLAGPDKELNV